MNANQINREQKQYDVFISYKSELLSFVINLVEWLEKVEGITCWFAPRNLDQTGAGRDYDDEIVSAINNSRCMVVILNDAALNSRWVKREVSHAEKHNKTIVPFAVSELTVDNGLRMRLDTSHFIAAYPNPEKKNPLLLKNIKLLLGQDVSGIKIQEDEVVKTKPVTGVDLDYYNGLAFLEVNQDRDAFEAFLRSAINGNKDAAKELVEIANRNKNNEHFLDDSTWEQIEALSDQGEGYADLLMHFRYYSMGNQQEIALNYLARSMKKYDSSIAYLQYGICFGWGLGVPFSEVLAKKYYEKALDKGCGLACKYLGQLYMYGSDKIEKDLIKAEDYLQRGVEMRVAECYEQLFWLYNNCGEVEKAKELAKQMIDQGVKGGYSLMGNYYLYCFQDQKQETRDLAREWYKKAVKHEEDGAWGTMAWICYEDGDKEEAYRLARRGYFANDSFSFRILGFLYESDGDLDHAWSFYHQSVLKFGSGQYGLARLYFDKRYLPDGYKLADLKNELELSAKKQNLDSIKYLLRLILLENNKDSDVISYDSLKDIPESFEFIRLGAKEGDDNCLYIYGRLLIESEGNMHNPFLGIDYIESALEKGNKDASEYLLNPRRELGPNELSRLYQNIIKSKTYVGKETATIIDFFNEHEIESGEENLRLVGMPYIEWLFLSLKGLVWEDSVLFFYCYNVFKLAIENSKTQLDVKNWLDRQVDDFINHYDNTSKLFLPFYAFLLSTKLSLQVQNDKLISFVRDLIKIDDDILNITKIHYFKDTIRWIWPDYSPEEILEGDFSNKRDLRIFYGIENDSMPDFLEIENETYSSDINNLFAGTKQTSPFSQGLNATKTKALFFAYTGLLESYRKLKSRGVAQVIKEDSNYDVDEVFPCCSAKNALQLCLNSFKMLVASRNAYGEKWQEIMNNLNQVNYITDIAETVTDRDAQALLCRYHDLVIARDDLLLFVIQLENGTCSFVVDTINAIIDELTENHIEHKVQRMSEDGLPGSIKEMTDVISTFAKTYCHYLSSLQS